MESYFASTYGSSLYDRTTYNGAASSTTASSSATTNTGTGAGVLTNTGFDVILAMTLAVAIIFVALITKLWRRPAVQTIEPDKIPKQSKGYGSGGF